jgi:hypothetical protein
VTIGITAIAMNTMITTTDGVTEQIDMTASLLLPRDSNDHPPCHTL